MQLYFLSELIEFFFLQKTSEAQKSIFGHEPKPLDTFITSAFLGKINNGEDIKME